jgi:hypothetical protein
VDAESVLCLGIGGGGDVVGALAAAQLASAAGLQVRVGGLTWERRPIDPLPGPRRLDELDRARTLNGVVALAGPDTRGPGGFLFAESRVAALLGEPTVLVDPLPGPAAIASGLADAARQLRCGAVVLLDVGGDVLAHGDEPGLASPLCDAVMLAAAARVAESGRATLGAIFGPGCDGELTLRELGDRLADLGRAGGLAGARGITPPVADRLEQATRHVVTEASAQALRAFRGAIGVTAIRGGRRKLDLTPAGALTVYFDISVAYQATAPLARAVTDAPDLQAASAALNAIGVETELDREVRAAAAGGAAA